MATEQGEQCVVWPERWAFPFGTVLLRRASGGMIMAQSVSFDKQEDGSRGNPGLKSLFPAIIIRNHGAQPIEEEKVTVIAPAGLRISSNRLYVTHSVHREDETSFEGELSEDGRTLTCQGFPLNLEA